MNIHFTASEHDEAKLHLKQLTDRYGQTNLPDATHIVALGGDGHMLHVLQDTMSFNLPVFGLNCGRLLARIEVASGHICSQYHMRDSEVALRVLRTDGADRSLQLQALLSPGFLLEALLSKSRSTCARSSSSAEAFAR